MGKMFGSGLLAGVVAAVIWIAISLWVGIALETVGLWALVLLVGTTLLVTIVGGLLASGVQASRSK